MTVLPGLMSYASFKSYVKEKDDYWLTTRLHGLLYEGADVVVLPDEWQDAAYELGDIVGGDDDLPCWMGVDAAGKGRDLWAWAIANRRRLVHLQTSDTKDTVEGKEITLQLMRQYDIPPCRVAVDATGGYGQSAVVDPLAREGKHVVAVDFGGTPTTKLRKKLYKNMRAELYGEASEWMDPEHRETGPDGSPVQSFALDRDDHETRILVGELSQIPKMHDGEGKMYLPPKDVPREKPNATCLKHILGHSPDRSDALVLCLWLMRGRRPASPRRRELVR